MDGTPGLLVELASVLVASKGSLDDLELTGSSSVRLAELPTSSTVEPGSTLVELAGVMADVDAPDLVDLGVPFTITLSGEPGGTAVLLASLGINWLDVPGEFWEMVGLADLGSNFLQVTLPLGGGSIGLPSAFPTSAVLWGFPIVLQSVVINPVDSHRRWSNVATIIADG
jgi:hypothetical protein